MDLLKSGKLDELSKSVPNKVSEILDCEPIASLAKNAGTENVQMYVESEIIKLAASVNVNPGLNIKDYQVPVIAEQLIENYKWESIEDFTLCFRRGSCGFYGEIFRLDGAVIGTWLSKYLDEKYQALEVKKEKEKKDTPAVDLAKDAQKAAEKYGKGTEFYKQAEEIAKKLIGKPDVEDNSIENEFQREKLSYKPPTLEQVRMMELHNEYILANYTPFGEKREEWMPENQWLELNT